MNDRLEEIESRVLVSRPIPVVDEDRLTILPGDDYDWLVSEIKRLREAVSYCREDWMQNVTGLSCKIDRLEKENGELRELAIGGDGSTHWYYKDQVESLAKENKELRRERSQD